MSAYLQPIEFKPFESNVDINFVASALQYKQQKFDANYEKLSSFFENMSNVDFVKEEDRQRYFDRLNSLRDEVNKFGVGDLSKGGVSENIMSHIGQAADEKTLNGYYGTLAIRKIQKEAEKAKEKGTYNPLNYEFSMREASEWINDGQAGSSYGGGSSYVPYTDVTAKIREVFKEHKPDVQVVTTKHGVQFINSKLEVMTEQEVEDILEGLVFTDPNVQQQLKVNAWGSFRGVDNASISGSLRKTIETQQTKLEEYKNDLASKIAKEKNPQTKTQMQEMLKAVDSRLTDTKQRLDTWEDDFNKNPDFYKEATYKASLTQQMKGIYVKDNIIDISSITDQAALEGLKHKNSIAQIKEKASVDRVTEGQKSLLAAYGKGVDLESYAKVLENLGYGTGFVEIAKNIIKDITPDSVDWEINAEDTKGVDGRKEYTEERTNVETRRVKLYNDLNNFGINAPLDADPSDIKSAIEDAINKAATNERGEIMKLLAEFNSISREETTLDRIGELATENALDNLKAQGRQDLGDGRKVFYKDGEYYIQDKRTVGESVGRGFSTAWDAVADWTTELTSKASLPNPRPKQGVKGVRLNNVLSDVDKEIGRLENIIKTDPTISNSDIKVVTDAIKELKKYKGRGDVSKLSWGEANSLYNELDNVDQLLNFKKGIQGRNQEALRLNEGNLFKSDEQEVLNILKGTVVSPKNSTERSVSTNVFNNYYRNPTLYPSKKIGVTDEMKSVFAPAFNLHMQEYDYTEMVNPQVIVDKDGITLQGGVVRDKKTNTVEVVESNKIPQTQLKGYLLEVYNSYNMPIAEDNLNTRFIKGLTASSTNYTPVVSYQVGVFNDNIDFKVGIQQKNERIYPKVDLKMVIDKMVEEGVKEEFIVENLQQAFYNIYRGQDTHLYTNIDLKNIEGHMRLAPKNDPFKAATEAMLIVDLFLQNMAQHYKIKTNKSELY